MTRIPKAEAAELAERIYEAMRAPLVQVVTELLCGSEDDDLDPRELAKVERTAARLMARMEGRAVQRAGRRKVTCGPGPQPVRTAQARVRSVKLLAEDAGPR